MHVGRAELLCEIAYALHRMSHEHGAPVVVVNQVSDVVDDRAVHRVVPGV